jgi:5-carboxymethyl-2-hydroxymuconate isomerase
LILWYSSNLAQRADLKTFCDQMRLCLLNLHLHPKAGIRVRTVAHDAYSIADNHPKNAFLDMTLRIGEGRTDVQKTDSAKAL